VDNFFKNKQVSRGNIAGEKEGINRF